MKLIMRKTYSCDWSFAKLLGLWNLSNLVIACLGSNDFVLFVDGLYFVADGLDLPKNSV